MQHSIKEKTKKTLWVHVIKYKLRLATSPFRILCFDMLDGLLNGDPSLEGALRIGYSYLGLDCTSQASIRRANINFIGLDNIRMHHYGEFVRSQVVA